MPQRRYGEQQAAGARPAALPWAPLLACLLAAIAQVATAAPQPACGAFGPAPPKRESLSQLLGAPSGAEGGRTVYMLPRGGLTDRLQAVASAATLARRQDASLVVVWPAGGDATECGAGWGDLFSSPALPLGPFPGGGYAGDETAGCRVHSVDSHRAYRHVADDADAWEAAGGRRVLCLESSASLVEERRHLRWFYQLLEPSQAVVDLEAPFLEYHQWGRWGQWIGVHAGAAAAAAAALKAAPSASSGGDHLALARHLAALPLDGESVPRFFIVGDDARQEEELQRAVWALNLTGAKGTALVAEKPHRGRPASLGAALEAAMDLHLLSKTTLIVGTPGSGMSRAAAEMGGAFLLLAGEGSSRVVRGLAAGGAKAGAAKAGAAKG